MERLPHTDHSLYVLPQTMADAVDLAMPVGAAHPAQGPQELGQAGRQLSPTQDSSSVPCRTAAQSHAGWQLSPTREPASSTHHQDLLPPPWCGMGTGSQTSPPPNPPPRRGVPLPVVALLPSGKGWLVNPAPLPGPCPGWGHLSTRMMPEANHFAGSFIQAESGGRGTREPGL